MNVLKVSTTTQLFEMLASGRVDFINFSEREADIILHSLNLTDQIDRLSPPLAENDMRFAFTKARNGKQHQMAFDKAIQDLNLGEFCTATE